MVKYDFLCNFQGIFFKKYGEGREEREKERDTHFLSSIVIGGLEQLEPLSESEFN